MLVEADGQPGSQNTGEAPGSPATAGQSPGAPGRPVGAPGAGAPPSDRLRPRSRSLAARIAFPALALLAYGALALLVYRISPLSTTSTVGCGCGDQVEQIWFLAWTPHAIGHGLNPFFSSAIDVPYGANLAANTSMPLLGLLAWPVTATLGPVASFNLLLWASFPLSGLAMCLALRRYVSSPAICFVAGLVYAFSPYMTGQALGHLNLLFVPLPPLIGVALDEVLRPRRWRPWQAGAVLGLLAAAQYLISAEVLADLAAVAVIVAVILVIAHPRAVLALGRARLARLAAGLGVAVGAFAVICGYPIAFFVAGPRHLNEPAQPVAVLSAIRIDLLAPITPTVLEWLAPAHLRAVGSSFGVGENGSYLGVPLLLAVIASLVLCWRNATVRALAVMGLVAFCCSLGPAVVVDHHGTGVWMPFQLFDHLPLLQDEVPARYSLLVLAAAVASAAVGFDRLLGGRRAAAGAAPAAGGAPGVVGAPAAGGGAAPAGNDARAVLRRGVRAALAVCAGAVVVIPLVPALPIGTAPVGVPAFFTSSRLAAVPPGSVLLSYPYDENPDDYAMLWQAVSGFRFAVIGGYANLPHQLVAPLGGGAGGGLSPDTLDPPFVQIAFQDAQLGVGGKAMTPFMRPIPPYVANITAFLRNYHVATVAFDPVGFTPAGVRALLVATLGQPQLRSGGLSLWLGVPSLLARRAAVERAARSGYVTSHPKRAHRRQRRPRRARPVTTTTLA